MKSRLFLAVACALTLSISGCSGVSPHQTASTKWTSCTDLEQQVTGKAAAGFSFDCATVKVPQNWLDPKNKNTIDIAMVRVRSNEQHNRIGSMLVDPGGPGGSGIELALYTPQFIPSEIFQRFDVVGFDPRGVGKSSPLRCFSDADLDALFAFDPDPVSDKDFNSLVTLSKKMATSCTAKYGTTLPYYSTEQAARDMDAIRQSVGDSKTTYLGYSYGTLLGAVYAELFPKNIRAMVLDGAIDPNLSGEQSAEGQAKGFELAFTHFAKWCPSSPDCSLGDARQAVTDLIQQAKTSPVSYNGRQATSGVVFTAVVSAMYSQSEWPILARALAGLRHNDATTLFHLADAYTERDNTGHHSNLFDVNLIVNCSDDKAPVNIQDMRKLQNAWRLKYPLFGGNLALNTICAEWQAARDPYPVGPAVGSPPIVVVGTTGDPATPYEQTAKLVTMLGNAVELSWDGEGHTAYPQTQCITNAVDQYLINLKTPALNTTCPAQ